MVLAALCRERIRGSELQLAGCIEGDMRSSLPEVEEDIWIPIGLLKASTINSLDPSLDTIDTNIVGAQSHNWPFLLVCLMYRLILGGSKSFPKNPYRREA